MDSTKRTSITNRLQQSPVDWQKVLLDSIACFDCSTGTLHSLKADVVGGASVADDAGMNGEVPMTHKAGEDRSDAVSMLHLVAQVGIPEFLLPKVSKIPIGKGMAGIAAERREPVEMCNLQTDTSGIARPGAKETKVEGSIAVPLMRNGVLYGTLGIAKPVPYEFTENERKELMALGEEIATILA